MRTEIRRISAGETWEIRNLVLRPGLPRETARFAGDDAPETAHFGAFSGETLLGIATVVKERSASERERETLERASPGPDAGSWRLRGMATMPESRGTGLGAALIHACLGYVRSQGGRDLWCYARTSAEGFYLRQGFQTLSEVFEVPGVGPHVLMQRQA